MKYEAKRVNYGILVAVDLALQPRQVPVQAKAIAKRQSIPARFLEHVLNAMKRAGLVESTRGAQGGYVLSKPPADLSLAQIVEALDGPIVVPQSLAARAASTERRGSEQQALLAGIWSRLRQAEMDVLNRITLKDLVEDYDALHHRHSPMYHI